MAVNGAGARDVRRIAWWQPVVLALALLAGRQA